jgi:hypothetical protein
LRNTDAGYYQKSDPRFPQQVHKQAERQSQTGQNGWRLTNEWLYKLHNLQKIVQAVSSTGCQIPVGSSKMISTATSPHFAVWLYEDQCIAKLD